jgi:hypothetical protein
MARTVKSHRESYLRRQQYKRISAKKKACGREGRGYVKGHYSKSKKGKRFFVKRHCGRRLKKYKALWAM